MVVSDLTVEARRSLKEEVQAHRVVYEVAKAERIVDGERRAIGFDLRLCGTHPEGVDHVLPGCAHCRQVHSTLVRIAEAVQPPEDRASRYTIRGFDHALHMAREREQRNDVELLLEIRHRDGYLDAIDDCERDCLDDMKDDLEALGVPYRVWR